MTALVGFNTVAMMIIIITADNVGGMFRNEKQWRRNLEDVLEMAVYRLCCN